MHSRPMEDLKVIKRRFGTTVNDVLLADSAGALCSLGEGQDIKAMVPVSVEALDEHWGNRSELAEDADRIAENIGYGLDELLARAAA